MVLLPDQHKVEGKYRALKSSIKGGMEGRKKEGARLIRHQGRRVGASDSANKGESRGRWRVYRRTVHLFATISSHEIDSGPADADEAMTYPPLRVSTLR